MQQPQTPQALHPALFSQSHNHLGLASLYQGGQGTTCNGCTPMISHAPLPPAPPGWTWAPVIVQPLPMPHTQHAGESSFVAQQLPRQPPSPRATPTAHETYRDVNVDPMPNEHVGEASFAAQQSPRESPSPRATHTAHETHRDVNVDSISDEVQDKVWLRNIQQGGRKKRQYALKQLHGRMMQLARQREGSIMVQVALAAAHAREQDRMLPEFKGKLRQLLSSPHGNYVAQKIFETFPLEKTASFITELLGHAVKTACHKFGCRVFIRIVANCAGCAEAEALIDEVLDQADCLEHTVPGLCRHTYARHVMMAIALHGPARHRERVTRALRAEGVALPTYSSLSSSTSLSVHVRGVWRRTRRRKWKPCLIVEKR